MNKGNGGMIYGDNAHYGIVKKRFEGLESSEDEVNDISSFMALYVGACICM